MNRLRKINGIYQVLITPSIKISPDSSLMIGNWEDEELRNFHILEFNTLQGAQCEALKHPDIDWYRLIINHKYIYQRLRTDIEKIIRNGNYTAEIYSSIMDPEMFKNTTFDRVLRGGERFNMRYGMSDIIHFTIVNPWTANLHKIAKTIEFHREYHTRDDIRIRDKKMVDGKIILLYGYTEFGTIYEIKLIPTLLYQWGEWYKKHGYKNPNYANRLYGRFMKAQDALDKGVVLR